MPDGTWPAQRNLAERTTLEWPHLAEREAAQRNPAEAIPGGASTVERERRRRCVVEFLIPGLRHFLVLGTILFSLGMYGVLSRRNAIGILLSIELMLNGVNLLFVAFARYIQTNQELAGQLFAIFIITQAAAEAAVGLAIIIAVYRQRRTIQVDQLDLMKG
jgi:NADH:ubiquinone oxidoreductase subunit K